VKKADKKQPEIKAKETDEAIDQKKTLLGEEESASTEEKPQHQCSNHVEGDDEPEGEIVRKLKKITLRTTDEEWQRYAQSCETMDPLTPITFRVKRFVNDDENNDDNNSNNNKQKSSDEL
jgi:hypothetical protein